MVLGRQVRRLCTANERHRQRHGRRWWWQKLGSDAHVSHDSVDVHTPFPPAHHSQPRQVQNHNTRGPARTFLWLGPAPGFDKQTALRECSGRRKHVQTTGTHGVTTFAVHNLKGGLRCTPVLTRTLRLQSRGAPSTGISPWTEQCGPEYKPCVIPLPPRGKREANTTGAYHVGN